MEQKKINDIKKALELNEYYAIEYFPKSGELKIFTFTDLITLINELESEKKTILESKTMWKRLHTELCKENRELKAENETIKFNMQETEKASFNINQMNGNLVLENQQLKDRIAELEKEKTCVWEEWTDGDHSVWCCSNCKEDFCFIEGDVYENNYGYCPHCGAKITALKELKEDYIYEVLKGIINE